MLRPIACLLASAVRATFALKTGEWLRRDLRVMSAPESRRYLRLQEQSEARNGVAFSGRRFRRTSFVSAYSLPPMPKPATPQHPSLYPERFDLIDAFRGLAALAVLLKVASGSPIKMP